jgi:hypothetical protein
MYFRDVAKSLGEKGVDTMSDLAVWKFLIAHGGKIL